MKDAIALPVSSVNSGRRWFQLAWKATFWIVLLGLIVHYVRRDALHYLFNYSPESFKAFWSIRILIRTHIVAAIIMIFIGPLQFWTGLRMRNLTLHMWSGRVFLVTGTFVACSAMYMGLHPRLGGVVYGFGLFLNGLFWVTAAGIAYYAIRLHKVEIHKEWVIRLYVLSLNGIVGDRLVPDMAFVGKRIGNDALNDLSGWVLWVVPLMVTEIVLQLRKLRRTSRLSS